MRAMVAETAVEPRQLILPVFVAEGLAEPRPISSMPGVVQHTLDSAAQGAAEAAEAGLAGVMLFGVRRRAQGRRRFRRAGPRTGSSTSRCGPCATRSATPRLVMSDVCLDEFTDHGHCGVLTPAGVVDNDATVEIYAEMARRTPPPGPTWSRPAG